jgi:hypothetical protein
MKGALSDPMAHSMGPLKPKNSFHKEDQAAEEFSRMSLNTRESSIVHPLSKGENTLRNGLTSVPEELDGPFARASKCESVQESMDQSPGG